MSVSSPLSDRDIMERALLQYASEHPNTTVLRSDLNVLCRITLDQHGRKANAFKRTASDVIADMLARNQIQRMQRGSYYLRPGKPAIPREPVPTDLDLIRQSAHKLALESKVLLNNLNRLERKEADGRANKTETGA